MTETTSEIEMFWDNAWALPSLEAANVNEDATVLNQIRKVPISGTVFLHKAWSDPAWMKRFRSVGLFEEIPDPIETEHGFQAPAWPVMDYLAAVASSEGGGVQAVLLGVRL